MCVAPIQGHGIKDLLRQFRCRRFSRSGQSFWTPMATILVSEQRVVSPATVARWDPPGAVANGSLVRSDVLAEVSIGPKPLNAHQDRKAWWMKRQGWGWEERKGLRCVTTADPGLQEPLSKQAPTMTGGQSPTSRGCRDNISHADMTHSSKAIRTTDRCHQQTCSPKVADRRLIELPRHNGNQARPNMPPSS